MPIGRAHITANALHVAVLNKMLPKGYKFDILELVSKAVDQHKKKTSGYANYNKKPEIQNEVKQ